MRNGILRLEFFSEYRHFEENDDCKDSKNQNLSKPQKGLISDARNYNSCTADTYCMYIYSHDSTAFSQSHTNMEM